MSDYEPCPFCGGKQFGLKSGFQVVCVTCGAEGPKQPIMSLAQAAWNARQPVILVDELTKLILRLDDEITPDIDDDGAYFYEKYKIMAEKIYAAIGGKTDE